MRGTSVNGIQRNFRAHYVLPWDEMTEIATNEHTEQAVCAVRYEPSEHAALWDAFIERSMNGTVFHSQQFLSPTIPKAVSICTIFYSFRVKD